MGRREPPLTMLGSARFLPGFFSSAIFAPSLTLLGYWFLVPVPGELIPVLCVGVAKADSVYAGNAIFCRLSSFSFSSLQHMLEYKLGFCVWQAFFQIYFCGGLTLLGFGAFALRFRA